MAANFGVIILMGLCVGQIIGQYNEQRITLYEGTNGQGNYLTVTEPYISQLGVLGFDGRARSACLTGMWMIYDLQFYNFAKNAPMQYHFGPNNYCIDLKEMQGKVSSIRSAGNFYDYRDETVTLFENTYFQGVDEFIFRDARIVNLDKRASSVIITGNSPWTVYDAPNFRGKSSCISPPRSNDHTPAIITDTNSVRMPNRVIRSVRKGCSRNSPKIFAQRIKNGTNNFF